MTLLSGDLTTPYRAATWLSSPPSLPSPILSQLIGSVTALIYSKLSRSRLYSQTQTRIADGVGNNQLVLPDFPVTSITLVQIGSALINPYPLPNPISGVQTSTFGYGYRFIPWSGNLPGEPCVLEFVNGYFPVGVQNCKITYVAGYLIQNEAWTIPASPNQVTVLQPNGIWCRDNGITYASSGLSLTPVTGAPSVGQYNIPSDSSPGLYTFSAADVGQPLLINYSFIPADLEEAAIQMVAERYVYRGRIGEISKSLGGQETVRFMRGGSGRGQLADLPPEVAGMIEPYISVVPPWIGAPV